MAAPSPSSRSIRCAAQLQRCYHWSKKESELLHSRHTPPDNQCHRSHQCCRLGKIRVSICSHRKCPNKLQAYRIHIANNTRSEGKLRCWDRRIRHKELLRRSWKCRRQPRNSRGRKNKRQCLNNMLHLCKVPQVRKCLQEGLFCVESQSQR